MVKTGQFSIEALSENNNSPEKILVKLKYLFALIFASVREQFIGTKAGQNC